jgi:hypothetical protein
MAELRRQRLAYIIVAVPRSTEPRHVVEQRRGHHPVTGEASSSLLPGVNTFVLGLRPAGAALLTPGPLRLLKGSHAPNLWFGAP